MTTVSTGSARRGRGILGLAGALVLATLITGCERLPMQTQQLGFRGTGMEQVTNPRIAARTLEANQSPEALPAAPADAPKVGSLYKNVQVLNDLNVAEFTRLMVSITNWVSPEQGCAYCHQGAEFESDALYTKRVARSMLQMTRHINSQWKNHVAETGVTCYTCHRGKPQPEYTWSANPGPDRGVEYLGRLAGQNLPSKQVGLTSLPFDPFSGYLNKADEIRVIPKAALPGKENGPTIQHTEATYALMMHFSQSLGVNCTFCHNSRSFGEWDQSPGKRTTAWYGIRMVRDVNASYVEPLRADLPEDHRGPRGDAPKVYCQTCHQGANKPLYGVSLYKAHPELGVAPQKPAPAPAAAAPDAILGRILFAVGRTELDANARAVIADAAKRMSADGAIKVALSGFADRTGNADANVELAKQRAFAVRDALKAAGVAETRIELRRPEFAVAGNSADARRVDLLPTK